MEAEESLVCRSRNLWGDECEVRLGEGAFADQLIPHLFF